MGSLDVAVLGPVLASVDGAAVPIRGRLGRTVLAALALAAGRALSVEQLIDALWGELPPATARQQVHIQVSRLRAAFGRAGAVDVIRTEPGGYRLAAHRVDIQEVGRLREVALAAGHPDAAAATLRAALGLWRGVPLSGISEYLAQTESPRLEELFLCLVEERVDAELAGGHAAAVVPELTGLVAAQPFREGLRLRLMQALYRSGRRADALRAFQEARQVLRDELGMAPPHALVELEAEILAAEPSDGDEPTAAVVPAQLPLTTRGFAGRTGELAELDAVSARPAPRLVLITGMPGVGKTAIAVHWAHRAADRYPDGQLYLNLRGFDPTGTATTPAEALRRFLDALDVPARRVPTDLDAQAALYRSQVSGRRMLIVLDNARDTAQIRPLLPGSATCFVIVTSRNQLTGLIAIDGAQPINLDLLPATEARELLARRIGADRAHAEPDAVNQIITRCARLPLALSIVAARAATRPGHSLTALADELAEDHDRLRVLTTDDQASDVRAVFSWSYRALTPEAARLFRLIGPHPGPDISAPAAASLSALPPSHARQALAELTQANLLVEHTPGRYTCHDLLRAYATELARTTDPDDQRHAATHRMLDHYLHTAHTVAHLLYPRRDPISLAAPQPGVTPEQPADDQRALAWFAAELVVLLAAIDHAASAGLDTHTWQLAWTLVTYLDRQGRWHDYAVTQLAAIAAATRLDDATALARAHGYAAHACTQLGRFDDADTHLQHALNLTRHLSNPVGQAHNRHNLAHLRAKQGRHTEALDNAHQALDLYQSSGDRAGMADALNSIGWYHAQLGDHQQALAACQRALALFEESADRTGQANSSDSLGYTHHLLGQHAQALTCYRHALTLFRELGDRYEEANTLARIGDTHHAIDDLDAARAAWQQALAILTDLDHPNAQPLHDKLAR
ncbi:MAG TPA: BTAD domain-containing putative transcriptional regulator [Pseudonocardiaceae bacterium]|jgi:DNA-binding SARP family transcriptional activator/tetratricopeptide (TPR) repeat protein|nr:BTAD domain-containing putative transcriptional regulator [Pseudonocardiaceae bacterium]